MNGFVDRSGLDPRQEIAPEELGLASRLAAPQVGRPPGGLDLGLVAGGLCAVALGGLTLFAMSAAKGPKVETALTPVVAETPHPAPRLIPAALAVPAAAPAAAAPSGGALDPNQSRANPLIIDNSGGGTASAAPSAKAAAPGSQTAPNGQPSQLLSADEQFVARVGGDGGPAYAQGLADPTATVMQGTLIPAVLETALNSDLPGYARAIVSRDVRGFDGAKVMIPRGSRLIGQYKSGLTTGQSRAFIVWTRLIRPDGVSVALGSPVMDEAGQTGLGGKVDRHFLHRFGGALLLSVVGVAPAVLSGGNTYVVSTGAEAQSAAAQALHSDAKIAPTIRVPLGTPIQVFVARDLAFGG
jgi:type IV secretion system protein VirB10